MTALAIDLLREVSEAGGTVRLEADMLRLSAPAPLPDDLRARLREHKGEVVALLAAVEPANDDAPVTATDDPAGLPAEVADGVQAILDADGARSVPPRRWAQIQRDTRRLVERRRLHEALGSGWATADLFGCDRRAPWYRLDRAGLVLLLAGAEIVELDPHHAVIKTPTASVLRYRRRPARPPVTLLWEVLTSAGQRPAWRSPGATGPPIRGPTGHAGDERMAATFLEGPRRHPDHDHPLEEEDHGCVDFARSARRGKSAVVAGAGIGGG